MPSLLPGVGVLLPTSTPDVRQVEVPPSARALSTLSRVDYEDASLAQVESAHDRTGEQWARAILEDAPVTTRTALRSGWLALGLQLDPGRPDRVLGWEVRRSGPDFALLGASSRLGMVGEVLCKRQRHSLLLATFLQLENPVARAVWAGVAPGHRQVVRQMLEQALRRAEDELG